MTKKVKYVEVEIESFSWRNLRALKEDIEHYITLYGEEAEFQLDTLNRNEIRYIITYKRMETDAEEADRLKTENELRERRHEMYLKLKEEFESGQTKT